METDTDDDELDDTVSCCVCKQITPQDLSLHPHLNIVNWAHCDKCDGWVHLAFCTVVRVVRRQSELVYPKCEDNQTNHHTRDVFVRNTVLPTAPL
ncbi:hypothetical protein DPMN_119067 [Dreissena polymorpha]|uniref:Uncharacterized protein n=1 Tax=Dreissena polymorpha TaxID=45954 RepID=A0A9D4DQ16_DREPO|nr:hypothetical protein DPMN_188417 [Dreissena polymorpha]KAH3817529.1 hypothetical protein DPMN_119067 [Dreissena polymorpha]